MICYKCATNGESCHRHKYKDGEEKVQEVRQDLESVVQASSETVKTINERLTGLKNMEEKQVWDYNVLCTTIKSEFEVCFAISTRVNGSC